MPGVQAIWRTRLSAVLNLYVLTTTPGSPGARV
jgi:hypothetical protein